MIAGKLILIIVNNEKKEGNIVIMFKEKEAVTNFQICGQLLGFVFKDGYQIKYLKIDFLEREYWVKLPKEIGNKFPSNIKPGCWLDVSGMAKKCYKTGKLKLKAVEVNLANLPENSTKSEIKPYQLNKQVKPSKNRILICGKSNCSNKGGNAICQVLQNQIKEQNLQGEIEVKITGCLKQCKKAPNLIMMPDKTCYSKVTLEQIPVLLEKHLLTTKT